MRQNYIFSFICLNIIILTCFLLSSNLGPSSSICIVYLYGVKSFLSSPEKDSSHVVVLLRLLLMCDYLVFVLERVYEFPVAVVFHSIVSCSGQYWVFFFFLRFWLMLGTTFPWIRSKFSRLWCCLPLRCLAAFWFGFLVESIRSSSSERLVMSQSCSFPFLVFRIKVVD